MNILLTSVGKRSYLVRYFKQAIEAYPNSLVYAANSITTHALLSADRHVLTPNISSAEYIDFIIRYCKENNISAIIPLLDLDVLVLSRAKKEIEKEGIILIAPYAEIVELCRDKYRLAKTLREHGLTTPYTSLDVNAPEFVDISHYPLIIKPRRGCGSKGLYLCHTPETLPILYQQCNMDIEASFLSDEANMYPTQDSVVIQQYIDGEELGLQIFSDLKGKYIGCGAIKKIEMRAGETWVAETLDDKALSTVAQSIHRSLGSGPILDIDLIYRNQKYYIIDVNPRFGGQYPFVHEAGADLPKQIACWLNGEEYSGLFNYRSGLTIEKDIIPTKIK